MNGKKYRIYIDESGNPDLDSSDNPNHRFLSLAGVILDLDYVEATLHPDMEFIKKKYFSHHPDDPVIFHRSEMVRKKSFFNVLRDKTILKKFSKELFFYWLNGITLLLQFVLIKNIIRRHIPNGDTIHITIVWLFYWSVMFFFLKKNLLRVM